MKCDRCKLRLRDNFFSFFFSTPANKPVQLQFFIILGLADLRGRVSGFVLRKSTSETTRIKYLL